MIEREVKAKPTQKVEDFLNVLGFEYVKKGTN